MMQFTFEMFEKRCREIAKEIMKNKKIKFLYGIHRGGLIPAVRISHLTGLPLLMDVDNFKPNAIAIIDDCVDSGKTRVMYEEYPNYFVLVHKQKEKVNEWIEYWWEED